MNTLNADAAGSCRLAIPGLHYIDARRALAWLEETFGAETRKVIDGPGGRVEHAEVWFGEAVVTLGSARGLVDDPTVSTGRRVVYITVVDAASVDALRHRAVRNKARVVRALWDAPYNGSREFGVHDPEGNYWMFGTYVPR